MLARRHTALQGRRLSVAAIRNRTLSKWGICAELCAIAEL